MFKNIGSVHLRGFRGKIRMCSSTCEGEVYGKRNNKGLSGNDHNPKGKVDRLWWVDYVEGWAPAIL